MTISEGIQVGTLLAVAATAFMNRWHAQKTEKITGQIHTLVNSNMEVQLRVNWLQARRIADLTKLPSDISLSDEAEKLYNEHKVRDTRAQELK